jgi:hypothetical protein
MFPRKTVHYLFYDLQNIQNIYLHVLVVAFKNVIFCSWFCMKSWTS